MKNEKPDNFFNTELKKMENSQDWSIYKDHEKREAAFIAGWKAHIRYREKYRKGEKV